MSVEILSWAILDAKGNPICDYDSIDDLGEDTSAVVPVEPQENGALYAYDKVAQPQQITVTLLFSGDYAAQEAAIAKIDAALRGLEAFTVVTPTTVRSNMTLIGASSTRSSTGGANLLLVDLTFQEVRSANVGGGSVAWSPKKATGASKVDGGKWQTRFIRGLFS